MILYILTNVFFLQGNELLPDAVNFEEFSCAFGIRIIMNNKIFASPFSSSEFTLLNIIVY